MEVTGVSFRKYEKSSMLGFANVEFDNCMEVKGWKLFKGKQDREFDISAPSEKDKTGKKDDNGNDKYWPLVFINFKTESGKNLMDSIRDKVIEQYKGGGSSGGEGSGGGEDWGKDKIPF